MEALRKNLLALLLLADSYDALEPTNSKEKVSNMNKLIGFRNKMLHFRWLAGFALYEECLQALSFLGLEIQKASITVSNCIYQWCGFFHHLFPLFAC